MGRTNTPSWGHDCSALGDVMVNVAIVPRRVGDGRPVRCTVATLTPGFGCGMRHCSHTPSHRRYVGASFEGAGMGRLLGAGHSGGRLLGVIRPWDRFLGLVVFLQPAAWTSRPQQGSFSYWRLEGRSRSRCLELPLLEIVAENKKFLRITKINQWSHLATREIGVHIHTLVDRERKRSRERG